MFQGEYRGKQLHPPDLDAVLQRAAAAGVGRCIVTAGSLAESEAALALVRAQRQAGSPVHLSCTVGVHPTRSLEWLPPAARQKLEGVMAAASDAAAAAAAAAAAEGGVSGGGAAAEAAVAAAAALAETEAAVLADPQTDAACAEHAAALRALAEEGAADGSVVAIGECGLDYDRLFFCPAAVQRRGFDAQLELAAQTGLPLFLHNRNTGGDFAAACAAHRATVEAVGGVAHSFDGDAAELRALLGLGIEIGLNGCSLKTADNLAVAAQVPLGALHLETDAPWCGIKRTHAGHAHVTRPVEWPEAKKPEKWAEGHVVKDRCEPCHIGHVLQVVAAAMGVDEAEVAEAATRNSERRFFGKGRGGGV